MVTCVLPCGQVRRGLETQARAFNLAACGTREAGLGPTDQRRAYLVCLARIGWGESGHNEVGQADDLTVARVGTLDPRYAACTRMFVVAIDPISS